MASNAAVQRPWARSCRAATSKASRTADLSASGCRRQRLDTLASALRGARRVEQGRKRVLDRWHARPTAARTAERTHWSRAGAPYATKVSMGAQRTSSQESRAHLHEQLLGQHSNRRRFGLASFLFVCGMREGRRRKRECGERGGRGGKQRRAEEIMSCPHLVAERFSSSRKSRFGMADRFGEGVCFAWMQRRTNDQPILEG